MNSKLDFEDFFLNKIKPIKNKYDQEREKNRFNIFTALHKGHDEVRLHSRFISYLLSPNSGHGLEDLFAKIFIRDILKIDENDFDLTKFLVIPNEFIKSEYKDIDILIINKTKRQAIIIENKIFADDSNRKGDEKKYDGYDGQLERYYNTIKTGFDKNGNEIKDFKCNIVFVYYLTMFEHKQPTDESIGKCDGKSKLKREHVKVIYYAKEIKKWLEEAVKQINNEKSVLIENLKQYINLINMLTNNDISIDERKKLRTEIAKDIESAKYIIDNFKHIKWHTVDAFWTKLISEIKDKFKGEYEKIEFYTDIKESYHDTITEITHKNIDINHGVLIYLKEEKDNNVIYISGAGTLSWGLVDKNKWKNFNDESIENICFSNFSSKNTFKLIDDKNIDSIIQIIIEEIYEEQENDFKNMNNK